MRCPKCDSSSERRFCPQCGLDLEIYAEIANIKQEVESIRKLVAARTESHPEILEPPPLPKPPADSHPQSSPPISPEVFREQTTKSKTGERFFELAIGQIWLLGIGVLVLIIGIGFFLKYAFDQHWIGPAARISIGFMLGVVFLVVANASHQRRLRGLDVGIGAVGLATLNLAAYAAAQIYRFLPDELALLMILLTTAIGVSLSILWGSQALAVLSFLGGYLAPLLFGVGQFDHLLFLGYLVILTTGSQLLACGKRWRSLNFVAAVLTWVLLATVTSSWDNYRPEWWQEILYFTQFVFVAHSIVPFVDASIRKRSLPGSIFLLALVNGLFCSVYSDYLLKSDKWPSALVCLGYSAVAAVFGLLLSRKRLSTILSGWLIGQALVFLLGFFGRILTGYWVPIAWSAELVALYWVAAKINDRMLLAGTVLLALTIIGALIKLEYVNVAGWMFHEFRRADYLLPDPDALDRWCGGLSVVVALLLITWLDRTARVGSAHSVLNRVYEYLAVATLFGFANQELHRFAIRFMRQSGLAGFSALWCAFAAGLMFVGVWRRSKVYRGTAIGLLFVTLVKVLVFDTAQVSTPYRILSCIVLGTVMVAVSFVYYRFSARLTEK
jgi:uncharacterized membrane protein